MRYPEFIKAGDTIGFVAPSFGCAMEPYISAFESAVDYFKDNGLYLADKTIVAKCNYFCYDGFLIKNAPYKFSVNPSIITL